MAVEEVWIWIVVFAGGMNSGKTDELVKAIDKAAYAHESILAINPAIDDRAARSLRSKLKRKSKLRKYDKLTTASISTVEELEQVFYSKEFDVLGIDEAQLLGHHEKEDKPNTCKKFVQLLQKIIKERIKNKKSLRVYISGLDMYADGPEPFEPMPDFLAMADEVYKLKAVCTKCRSKNAGLTQKLTDSTAKVDIGDTKGTEKKYAAVCRICHTNPGQDS